MSTAMIYTGLLHDRAALARAGFPLALKRLLTRLSAGHRQRAGLSREEQACLEAAQVREMAHGFERTDPGFASDLCAAADRHEVENGVGL